MIQKFFIVAGEPSGDVLGAKLIKEIKSELAIKNQKCSFIGVGGKMMIDQGLESIFDISELSLMGFLEIIPSLFRLIYLINKTAKRIIAEEPVCLITIDSPDFNFRVVKKMLKLAPDFKIKKIHLIAPSVWAYRAKRAQKIAKIYDLLLAILPFEPPYFEKYNLRTVFIGHPIIENAPDFSKKTASNIAFRKKYNLQESDLLLLVTPGSRIGEIKRIFPVFIEAINLLNKQIPNLKIIIPIIDKTASIIKEMAAGIKVDFIAVGGEEKESAFFSANYALAKSGTNTLEISLFQIPMIIGYKVNILTYFLLKLMIKIKFANLINLILSKELIPELLQYDCEPKKIADKLILLITKADLKKQQIDESQEVLKLLGLNSDLSPSKKAAREILI
jgi:lipid-A-disaccharide synthase